MTPRRRVGQARGVSMRWRGSRWSGPRRPSQQLRVRTSSSESRVCGISGGRVSGARARARAGRSTPPRVGEAGRESHMQSSAPSSATPGATRVGQWPQEEVVRPAIRTSRGRSTRFECTVQAAPAPAPAAAWPTSVASTVGRVEQRVVVALTISATLRAAGRREHLAGSEGRRVAAEMAEVARGSCSSWRGAFSSWVPSHRFQPPGRHWREQRLVEAAAVGAQAGRLQGRASSLLGRPSQTPLQPDWLSRADVTRTLGARHHAQRWSGWRMVSSYACAGAPARNMQGGETLGAGAAGGDVGEVGSPAASPIWVVGRA